MPEQMQEAKDKGEVRIHIDERRYETPNPIVGEALYKLGNVAPGLDLYREVTGDREDEVIPDGLEVVHLKEDEHFHSGPPVEYTIIVNGRRKEVTTKTLSFDQVVALAFNPVPVGPNVQFSITYRKGPQKNPEGTLTEGQTVKIKNGMVFDVTETNKS